MPNDIDVYEFPSLKEFARYADMVPAENFSRTNSENKWAGGTFADALRQAEYGNSNFASPFVTELTELERIFLTEHEYDVRDITGEYFDVGDFLSGEPEYFFARMLEEQKPIMTIAANIGMNWLQTPALIRRRGCAILALADQLLTRGFQITMKLVESFVFEGKKIVFSIQIHQSPLELNDAVFVLANPLCLRRLGFAVLERVMHRSNCEGYGCPEDFSVNELFSDDECGFYFWLMSQIL